MGYANQTKCPKYACIAHHTTFLSSAKFSFRLLSIISVHHRRHLIQQKCMKKPFRSGRLRNNRSSRQSHFYSCQCIPGNFGLLIRIMTPSQEPCVHVYACIIVSSLFHFHTFNSAVSTDPPHLSHRTSLPTQITHPCNKSLFIQQCTRCCYHITKSN